MELKDSAILQVSISRLFPFIVLYSLYLFSYGPNSPGGGFQAGVMFGTIVVLTDLLFRKRVRSDVFYVRAEFAGVALLFGALLIGAAATGRFFGDGYRWRGAGLLYSNVFCWFLNMAIFLEVAGSIVLIFRTFLSWSHERIPPA